MDAPVVVVQHVVVQVRLDVVTELAGVPFDFPQQALGLGADAEDGEHDDHQQGGEGHPHRQLDADFPA